LPARHPYFSRTAGVPGLTAEASRCASQLVSRMHP
jgi:hypothetical protein